MTIAENLSEVKARIAEAAIRVGRDPQSVQLVAVSKVHPAEAIREAYAAGQRHFGENYVQELVAKQKALADLDDIQWHFIGHLQTNKIKNVVGRLALLETVDSSRLLGEIEKRAAARDVTVPLLLQVKIGGEESKSGCDPNALPHLLNEARNCPHVSLRGLMVIPPFELEAKDTRRYFRELRELRDQLGKEQDLPQLSMGMSHDFQVAIAEGATLVRVGTAIFGQRRR